MKSSYTLVFLAICFITTRARGYSCPEGGVDFNENDIGDDYFHNFESWQDCGKYYLTLDKFQI